MGAYGGAAWGDAGALGGGGGDHVADAVAFFLKRVNRGLNEDGRVLALVGSVGVRKECADVVETGGAQQGVRDGQVFGAREFDVGESGAPLSTI